MKIYKVGGAVRDRLLGLKTKDCDWVVVGATPAQMESLGYTPVGRDFPVFLHPQTHEEYALARTERKSGRGYKGFTVHASPEVTLEEDLQRRDLTINAMAEDEQGALVDLHGGQADLNAKTLRHVSPAFVEDPLRVLRVARFAAQLDFTVAPETLALMRTMAADGELNDLTAERVWQETVRALAELHPRRYIEVLRECGALAVLFPEIDRLFGVPQRADYHPEVDTGVHILLVLDQAARLSDDPRIRFAALMHDLGKGTTPAEFLPRHHGHEERSVRLLEELCDRCRVPNDYRELAIIVARYHGLCHRADELRPDTKLKLLESTDAFRRPERFEQFLLACEADRRGRLGLEDQPYPQADLLRRARQAAVAVDTTTLLERGLAGEAFAGELHQLRTAAIRALTP
ncbi:MAG TPA: multifunctional CCA addition/repair protein [Gammaproteobacteria bacterium]|nr:multifunctional CCA addition/repair protein [Gammaproteobacteria bacterium]